MNKKISISYDREADVVYLIFKRTKAEAEEISEGVFARYEPGTKELAGITILNFSRKFTKEPSAVSVPAYR